MAPTFESSPLHRRSHSSPSSIFSSNKNDSSFSGVSKFSGSSADGFAPSSKGTPLESMLNGHYENKEEKVLWTNRSTDVPKGRPKVYHNTLTNNPPSLSRSSSAYITKVPDDFLESSFVEREESRIEEIINARARQFKATYFDSNPGTRASNSFCQLINLCKKLDGALCE